MHGDFALNYTETHTQTACMQDTGSNAEPLVHGKTALECITQTLLECTIARVHDTDRKHADNKRYEGIVSCICHLPMHTRCTHIQTSSHCRQGAIWTHAGQWLRKCSSTTPRQTRQVQLGEHDVLRYTSTLCAGQQRRRVSAYTSS